jgi:Zn-dependent protease with chaperone function
MSNHPGTRSDAFEARIRANRRRMVIVTLLSFMNLWVLIGLLALVVLLGGVLVSATGTFLIASSLAALVSLALVSARLSSAPHRIVTALGARKLNANDPPVIANLLAELAIGMNIPVPNAGYAEDPAPNAIAVGNGPRNTTVIVTSGLVDTFPHDELEAVFASVVCSIAARDVALGTLASACVGQTVTIANNMEADSKGRASRLGRLASALPRGATAPMRRSIASSRSTSADIFAVETTRNPMALLRALQRFEATRAPARHWEAADPQMWFVAPVAPADAPELPTITERIRAIENAFGVTNSQR